MPSKTTATLVGAVIIALIVGAALGYFYQANELNKARESNMMMEQEMHAMSPTTILLTVQQGQMAHDVWLVIAPRQGGNYVLVLHAQGLESNGSYIVEGVTRGQTMTMVPLTSMATDSEFLPDQHGSGTYWTTLNADPRTTFEKVQLLYLPNMQMQNAILVASAALS